MTYLRDLSFLTAIFAVFATTLLLSLSTVPRGDAAPKRSTVTAKTSTESTDTTSKTKTSTGGRKIG